MVGKGLIWRGLERVCGLDPVWVWASAGALHPHHSDRLLYLHIPTIVNTRIQHMGGRELVFGGLGGEEGGGVGQ